ncbi:MAG: LD-carboxypeptidase [Alphaproteobacteria bacterium]|nr:LD-carboxypeptidase [Alphaproteobacteria bacterium]
MQAPLLVPGDTIGVMAPSSYVERDDIEKSKAVIENLGFKVFVHPQTFERDRQSAGTALQKTLALQGLWQRPDIKAIWAAGGGNRALHLLDSINFEAMKRTPKILVGFSDVTALLNGIYAHTGLAGIHGPVFKHIHEEARQRDVTATLALLQGNGGSVSLAGAKVLRAGTAKGTMIGGNLSVFMHLPGTAHMPDPKGAILFLEDASDHLSRFDRMFWHLHAQGIFKDLAALVIGTFTDLQEGKRPFGFTLEEIIREYTEGYKYPLLMDAPFGHGDNLRPFYVGREAVLETDAMNLKFNNRI